MQPNKKQIILQHYVHFSDVQTFFFPLSASSCIHCYRAQKFILEHSSADLNIRKVVARENPPLNIMHWNAINHHCFCCLLLLPRLMSPGLLLIHDQADFCVNSPNQDLMRLSSSSVNFFPFIQKKEQLLLSGCCTTPSVQFSHQQYIVRQSTIFSLAVS